QPGGGPAGEALRRSPAHGGAGGRGLSDRAPRAELRGGTPGRRPARPRIPGPPSRGRPRARPGARRRGSGLRPAAVGLDSVESAPAAWHFESAVVEWVIVAALFVTIVVLYFVAASEWNGNPSKSHSGSPASADGGRPRATESKRSGR